MSIPPGVLRTPPRPSAHPRSRDARRALAASALCLAVAACGPTYAYRHLAEDLQALCLREYHLSVRAQLVGHDVAVACAIEGLLKPTDRKSVV